MDSFTCQTRNGKDPTFGLFVSMQMFRKKANFKKHPRLAQLTMQHTKPSRNKSVSILTLSTNIFGRTNIAFKDESESARNELQIDGVLY